MREVTRITTITMHPLLLPQGIEIREVIKTIGIHTMTAHTERDRAEGTEVTAETGIATTGTAEGELVMIQARTSAQGSDLKAGAVDIAMAAEAAVVVTGSRPITRALGAVHRTLTLSSRAVEVATRIATITTTTTDDEQHHCVSVNMNDTVSIVHNYNNNE